MDQLLLRAWCDEMFWLHRGNTRRFFELIQLCCTLELMEAYCSFTSESREKMHTFCSLQLSSVAQLCPTLCNPMNRSTPGLPVHHQLPESTQTHVHCVSNAYQPSHPLSSPSPPALNLSQHQGLFK